MSYGLALSDLQPIQEMPAALWEEISTRATAKPLSALKKYWGEELVLENTTAGVWKRIDMNARTQSSMEYHVRKEEVYFLVHGHLDIGIRLGRAENHTLHMHAGDFFPIPRGLMHQRLARTDVVLVEWASLDDPKDSHLVHDGRYYQHKDGPADAI